MYFAILWKNRQLSLEELKVISNNVEIKWNVVFFESEYPERLNMLAGFPKWGKVIDIKQLSEYNLSLVGVNVNIRGDIKEKLCIKRYKYLDNIKSDLEIKEKGVEIIFFDRWKRVSEKILAEEEIQVWVVQGYQNIALYESIDFEKPVRSMNIGMMPAKLAHLLLNISTWFETWNTIYDPFCWFGTTLFVANYFGLNTIWSDINIASWKQNLKWWQKTSFANLQSKTYLFKHDIKQEWPNNVVKNATNVVSEWRLGPKVWKFLDLKQAEIYEKQIQEVYIKWIKNLLQLNAKNMVLCVPAYKLKDRSTYLFQNTLTQLRKNCDCTVFDEVYFRTWQKVGRQIVIIKN